MNFLSINRVYHVDQIGAWLLFTLAILTLIEIMDSKDFRYFWSILSCWLVFASWVILEELPLTVGYYQVAHFFGQPVIRNGIYVGAIVVIILNIFASYGGKYEPKGRRRKKPTSPIPTDTLH